MLITDEIFVAFLNCETKAYLKFSEAPASGLKDPTREFSTVDGYKRQCFIRLCSDLPETVCLKNLPFDKTLRTKLFISLLTA